MSQAIAPTPALGAIWPAAAPGMEAYAVLDGARDERIAMLVGLLGLEQACLYGDAAGPDLRQVAPYLVRLEQSRQSAEDLVGMAWGNAAAIFALAPAGTGFARMARHFRRLVRVMDEAGTVMLFRFYDPRVLRAFIPTCTAEQRAELFGPARRLVMEGPDGAPRVFTAEGAA